MRQAAPFLLAVLMLPLAACKARTNSAQLRSEGGADAGASGDMQPTLAPGADAARLDAAANAELPKAVEKLADELAAIAKRTGVPADKPLPRGKGLGLGDTTEPTLKLTGDPASDIAQIQLLLADVKAKVEAYRERGDDSAEAAAALKLVGELQAKLDENRRVLEMLGGAAPHQGQTQQPQQGQGPQQSTGAVEVSSTAQNAGAQDMPAGSACDVGVAATIAGATMPEFRDALGEDDKAYAVIATILSQPIWTRAVTVNVPSGNAVSLSGDVAAQAKLLYVRWPEACASAFGPGGLGASVVGRAKKAGVHHQLLLKTPGGTGFAIVRVKQDQTQQTQQPTTPVKVEPKKVDPEAVEVVDEVTRKYRGKAVSCQEYPGASTNEGQNWALAYGDKWMYHANGAKEMMTRASCIEALGYIKNGLICAGRRSAYSLRSNGLFRLEDGADLGTGYSMSWWNLCFHSVQRSSKTQACSVNDNGKNSVIRIPIAGGEILQTYKNDDFWTCIADAEAQKS